jgi:2-iminobutanoate/2-iminopropanoate deaminase
MEIIFASNGPAPVGPYAHAVRSGNTVYISGQVPFDPASGELVGTNIAEQTRLAMQNLQSVLAAAGLSLNNLLKATVYLADFNDFAGFNTVYAEFLGNHKPARACVEVSKIAKGALLEIEAVAEVPVKQQEKILVWK